MYIETTQKTHHLPFIFSWLHLLNYLFLHIKITWAITCRRIFCILPSLFQPEFQSFVLNSTAHYALHNNSPTDDPKHQQPFDMEETELRGEDIKMVLQRLGISPSPEDAGEKMIPALFADEEPSLEEVMEAFHVFDENRDGFIDAKELQRILSKLGFREASNPNLCNVMIRAFDENGDGRIDFKEFVKLIEKDFC